MDRGKIKSMTDEQLLDLIDSRMIEALMFHYDMMVYFKFLALDGYAKMHEYQYFEESKCRKDFQCFVLESTNKIACSHSITNPDVIPDEWLKHTRMDVGSSVMSKSVGDSFRQYIRWEEETCKMYESIACEFLMREKIRLYSKIKELVCEVNEELQKLYSMYENLVTSDFDVTYILDCQKYMEKEYKEKFKKMF